MRILVQNRSDAFTRPGGDTVQMEKTCQHLQRLGVDVRVSLELRPDVSDVSLVHLFNTNRIHETYMQFRNAKEHGKALVVSPIYHNVDAFDYMSLPWLIRFLAAHISRDSFEVLRAVYLLRNSWRYYWAVAGLLRTGYCDQQKAVLSGADMILPNSETEYAEIIQTFDICPPAHVVYNGVSIEDLASEEGQGIADRLPAGYILAVGRIEPLKNQLNFLRAVQGLQMPLVLVGSVNSHYPSYARSVLSLLSERKGVYLGPVPHAQLGAIYRKARVHALLSWFETTGLVSLEAAVCGCNIVSTRRGYAAEYLGPHAWYCEPDQLDSIRQACLSAYEAEPSSTLRDIVLARYRWDLAAASTLKAYKAVLAKSSPEMCTQDGMRFSTVSTDAF